MPYAFRFQLIDRITREVVAEAPDFAAIMSAKRLLGHERCWVEFIKP